MKSKLKGTISIQKLLEHTKYHPVVLEALKLIALEKNDYSNAAIFRDMIKDKGK